MSWQATAWAVRQKTGSSSRKVLLLVLANYADENGVCWPSQEVLKAETEMSEDTIQRQSKILKALGLVRIVRRRRKDGTWPALLYQLNLSAGVQATPQNAARPEGEQTASTELPAMPQPAATMPHPAADHAALTTSTIPQSLRHKPSIEPSLEPSLEPSSQSAKRERAKPRQPVGERLKAFQRKQVGTDVIQARIASRLGTKGWEILQGLTEDDLRQLTALERRGHLDESTLNMVHLHWRGAA